MKNKDFLKKQIDSKLLNKTLLPRFNIPSFSFRIISERPPLFNSNHLKTQLRSVRLTLLNMERRNFSELTTNKIHYTYPKCRRLILKGICEAIENHYNKLRVLRSDLDQKKNDLLSSEVQFLEYTCRIECLTLNKIESRGRFQEKNLTFFINESRNNLKTQLKQWIENYDIADQKGALSLQIVGPAGVGKSYGIGDFVVIEKMKNVDTKNHILLYHHFNEKTNLRCFKDFRKELLCAIYPLIEKDLKDFIKSDYSMIIEENSLLHLILEITSYEVDDQQYHEEELDLIGKILKKIKDSFPEKRFTIVLDQINEIKKRPNLNEKNKQDGESLPSFKLFDFLLRKANNTKINLILCASNNNEFSRNEMLMGDSKFITLNYDLDLQETEVVGFLNKLEKKRGPTQQEVKEIFKITHNVPLFLNMFRQIAENKQAATYKELMDTLREKIDEFTTQKAENYFNNYYMKFDNKKKGLFRDVLFHLGVREKQFCFEDIKEIIDYQLMEVGKIQENQANTKNEYCRRYETIKEFYDYIENKIDNKIPLQRSILPKTDENVRVTTRYPFIIRSYKKVFNKYNEDLLITNEVDLEIRDYLNNYNLSSRNTFVKREINIVPYRSKGLLFEDIVILYFKQLKLSPENINYPKELEFLYNWNIFKKFDVLDKDCDDDYKKTINLFEDLKMVDPDIVFSTYPPRRLELIGSMEEGLFFNNLSENHPSIDGGFGFWEGKYDEDLGKPILRANIYTFDVTLDNKFTSNHNNKKIMDYISKLKEIEETLKRKLLMHSESFNLVNHYFFILENEKVYDETDPFPKEEMIKARGLYERIENYSKEVHDRDLEFIKRIKIYVIRFILREKQGKIFYSLELIPFDN